MHEVQLTNSELTAPDPGHSKAPFHVVVLSPVFDDWAAAEILLQQLDRIFEEQGDVSCRVIFINDCPTMPVPERFPAVALRKIQCVSILELRISLGHQRAVCVGLVYLHQAGSCDTVVIMDADGEDSPADVPALLQEYERYGGKKVVFASRARRTESLLFRIFYQLYRTVHRVLVGFDIRVGNFSVVPPSLLDSLVVVPELWNHYAAAVVKAKLPCTSVPVKRAKRIMGESKMGFVGLVVHGLSAMSVYGDTVGVRLLVASAGLAVLTVGLLAAVLVIRFATPLAIPTWATYGTGLLLVLLSQWFLLSLIFTFVVLHSRGQYNFVPLRDCPLYVKRSRVVFGTDV